MKKTVGIGLICIVMMGAGLFYIKFNYFYNPLSFEKDSVTPHNWSAYERPITIKLYTTEDKREIKTIQSEDEIREVIDELKSSPPEEEASDVSDVTGGLTLTTENRTLLEVLFYTDHWRVLKNEGPAFQITDSLKRAVNELW
ncbi:hypothetical protein [Halobacillus massiliensis]|uniref:hypothetical protein n=1 Tax=Halobacillus massiliensis TaxID=1926286 RepID=UPI0009E53FB3|nr:hypothetical protein [Halobacillus massiliensis]